MFARQQELNTQFHQLLGAALLAFSLFTAQAGLTCPIRSIVGR
jgi:hypothetical protein